MGRPKSTDPAASRTFAIRRSVEAKMDALNLHNRSSWLNRVIEDEVRRIEENATTQHEVEKREKRILAVKNKEQDVIIDSLGTLDDLTIIEHALKRVNRHNRTAEKPLKQLESNLFKAYQHR